LRGARRFPSEYRARRCALVETHHSDDVSQEDSTIRSARTKAKRARESSIGGPIMDKQKANGLEIAAWVGWDWADKQHEVAIQQEGSAKVERQTIAQQPERLREWVEGMRARFGGAKIAIAIEQARGPVIYALMSYDVIVLYPINPKSLARFREALRPSRAKDDPADAELLLELITKHRDRFRPWMPDDHRVREMRTLVEYRRTTVNEQGRYAK